MLSLLLLLLLLGVVAIVIFCFLLLFFVWLIVRLVINISLSVVSVVFGCESTGVKPPLLTDERLICSRGIFP